MKKLQKKSTLKSPKVEFDAKKAQLDIEGRSILEDPATFYEELFKWIEDYFNSEFAKDTTIRIKLEYVNSSSSKYLSGIFQIAEKIADLNINIIWLYEEQDESMQELGVHFKNNFNVNVELVEYHE